MRTLEFFSFLIFLKCLQDVRAPFSIFCSHSSFSPLPPLLSLLPAFTTFYSLQSDQIVFDLFNHFYLLHSFILPLRLYSFSLMAGIKKRNIYTSKSSDRRLASGKKAELYLHSAAAAPAKVSQHLNPKHFRLFVGNLGADVSDSVISASFGKYPSLSYVKVPVDPKTRENKGFGFVAFASSQDYLKAFKEMNGKYVGLRPVQLKRAEGKPK